MNDRASTESEQPSVRILQLPPESVHALAAGDIASARAACGLPLPGIFVSADWIGTWQRRSAQILADPVHADWVTGAVIDQTSGSVIGKAGFHEPPDHDGMVEVGYQIDPQWQRQGYGTSTLAWLLDRAVREPAVRVVRACVSPDNVASLAMVAAASFEQVDRVWDEDDQCWELDFRYVLEPDLETT